MLGFDSVRTRRRHSLAITVSVVVHAITLLWGMFGWTPKITVPEIDLEFTEVKLIDPDLLQGLSGEPEPPPEPPPPDPTPPPEPPPEPEPEPDTKAEDEQKKKEEEERKKKEAEEKRKKAEERRKKKAEQRKNFAKKGTSADQLSPPTSKFHVLLVPKTLKKLPFAEKGFALLEPWPDFDFLVRKGGLDPLQDFNHIVIASANITDATETFLAVDFRPSRAKVKKAIERAVEKSGQEIEWVESGGYLQGAPRPKGGKKDVDDRVFVFHPKKKIAMLIRKPYLDQALADDDTVVSDAKGSPREFVNNLVRVRKFAAEQPLAGMQLKVADLSSSFSGLSLGKILRSMGLAAPADLATPDSIEVSIEASKNPILVLKLGYADLVDAKQFQFWFDEDLGDALKNAVGGAVWTFGGVRVLFEAFSASREDTVVAIRGELEQKQIETILDFVVGTTKSVTKNADEQRAKKRKDAGGS